MTEADAVRSRARLMPARAGTVRPNRALAAQLESTYHATYWLDIRELAAPRLLTPEERLLKAIFGEKADVPEGELVEVGREVIRGDQLFQHTQGRAIFHEAQAAVVERAERITSGLPEGVVLRLLVKVRWPAPLCVGDTLVGHGVIDGFEDDGDPEPRLYLAALAGDGEVIRQFPSAAQQMFSRSIGPYDVASGDPLTGIPIRGDQLDWLFAAGGRALISDYATYHLADRILRTQVFEQMCRMQPIVDGYTAAAPAAEPAAPATGMPLPGLETLFTPATPAPAAKPDIFNFFAPPGPVVLDRLRRLELFARCAGLAITREGHALRIAQQPPAVGAWSRGPVDDLASQRVFGPKNDYTCECGKYSRMKFRGTVCEVCGVEVIQSSARRERLAHIALRSSVTPRRFPGSRWDILPVLPPDLRSAELDRAYARVLAGDLDGVDPAIELVLGQIVGMLALPRYSDYSASALAIVGTRNRASSELLCELALPLVFGASEAAGFTTTIKSAKKLVAIDPVRRSQLVEMVMHDRVVLVGRHHRADLVAVRFEPSDDPVVELDPETAARLEIANGDVVLLHLPISDAAQHEAKTLAPKPARAPNKGWIHDVAQGGIDQLTAAAQANKVDRCMWPQAALFVGGYPYEGSAPALALGPAPERAPLAAADLDRSVDELELSVRSANLLQNAEIRTVRDLVQLTEGEILKMRSSGRKVLKELKEILAEMGFSLGMKV